MDFTRWHIKLSIFLIFILIVYIYFQNVALENERAINAELADKCFKRIAFEDSVHEVRMLRIRKFKR